MSNFLTTARGYQTFLREQERMRTVMKAMFNNKGQKQIL